MSAGTQFTDDAVDVDTLNDGQEIGLYCLTMLSSTISIIGSSTIVLKVMRNFHRTVPYDRLLLGLSVCDIVASSTYFVTPFLLPRETSPRAWASGNEATCTALGFFTQFSYSAFVYNGMLSFYYLMTVRYNIKRDILARHYEPWMHCSVVTFFLATATVGAAIGLYSELDLGPGCWIRDYPRGCYETGGCTGHFFGWIFTGLPTLFVLVSVIVNNFIIYCHVKRILGVATIHNDSTHNPSTGEESTVIIPNQPTPYQQRHRKHIQEVAHQGFLYVGSFFLCFSCQFVLRVLETSPFPADEKEGQVYWLLVLDAFLRPLQGIVNLLIYTRPNYKKLRTAFPEMSMVWALRKAFTNPDIHKLISSSGRTTSHPYTTTGVRSGGISTLPSQRWRQRQPQQRHPHGMVVFPGGLGNGNGPPNRTTTSKSHKSGSYVSDLPVVSEGSDEDASLDDLGTNEHPFKIQRKKKMEKGQKKKKDSYNTRQRGESTKGMDQLEAADRRASVCPSREGDSRSLESSTSDSRNDNASRGSLCDDASDVHPLEKESSNDVESSTSCKRLGMDGNVYNEDWRIVQGMDDPQAFEVADMTNDEEDEDGYRKNDIATAAAILPREADSGNH